MTKISFDKYINYLIIGYAFVLPTTIAGIVFLDHLIILSFILRWKFAGVLPELKQSKIILALGALIAFSLVAVLWSSDKIFALSYIQKYYHFLAIPIIYLVFNPKYIQHVFTSFLLGMLLSEILSYGIYFELIHFNNVLPDDPSPFMNHSEYSIYLSFAAMILLNRIFFTEHNRFKLFYFLYFLTTTSNLFINGGRTGQFIFIASIFVILILNFKNKAVAILSAVLLSTAILTTAYNVSPVFQQRGDYAYRDITETLVDGNYHQSFGKRVSLWIMGTHVFKDNFLLGTGIGDEKTGMQQYADKYNITLYQGLPDHGYIDYHNMYIQYAVQLGIPGLIIICYLVYSLFMLKFNSAIYRNLNIAFATSILIAATVGNMLHTIFPMVYFAFFVAILSAISRYENKINAD